jgi:hypothetical protein
VSSFESAHRRQGAKRMTAPDITSVTGWIGFVLIGLEVLFPYLLRRNRMSLLGSVEIGAGTPYLKRMWPHYWLGYLLLLLSLIHTVVPIQAGRLHGPNVLGWWLEDCFFYWCNYRSGGGCKIRF